MFPWRGVEPLTRRPFVSDGDRAFSYCLPTSDRRLVVFSYPGAYIIL